MREVLKMLLDRARMRQANRIFDSRGQVLTKKELVNLEAQDIYTKYEYLTIKKILYTEYINVL